MIDGDMNYEGIYGRDCHKCTPIKTALLLNSPRPHILTPEESAEVLATFADVDWDDEEKRFFYANYVDIMKGKNPKWKLGECRHGPNALKDMTNAPYGRIP